MSRLSDDEKRFLTDQISMLKGENERLTKYAEYSKDDKECMQNEIDVLKAKNEALRSGIQDIRNIAGTEWGRVKMDSPWGKTLFWIMQKCDALLTGGE